MAAGLGQQERTARYEGEGFAADALDEVDTLVFEALQAAEAAWTLLDTYHRLLVTPTRRAR